VFLISTSVILYIYFYFRTSEENLCCCGCGQDASTSRHFCSVTSKRIMAWCETVEFGKGPCKGCLESTVLEISGSSAIETKNIEDKNDSIVEVKDDNDTENDPYDDSDDENSVHDDYFANLKELGILDDSYNGPKSPLDAAAMLSSHKKSYNDTFGWRSGGVQVQYKSSERGGLINKKGKSRFFLDRVDNDGSIMVRQVIILL